MKSRKLALALLIPGIMLVLVSIAFNFQFGFLMGQSAAESWIYGVALASMDVVKAVLPVVIVILLAQNQLFWVISASATFLTCTLLSLSSSFSYTVVNQANDAGERRVEAKRYQVLNDQLSQSMQARQALSVVQPAPVLSAEIAGMQQHRRWRSSESCTNATVKPSIVFCGRYQDLVKQRTTAQEAARLDATIVKLREELKGVSPRAASGEHPPHLVALGQLLFVGPKHAATGRAVLISVALELTSGLVFVFATMVWPSEPWKPGSSWRWPSWPTRRRTAVKRVVAQEAPKALPAPVTSEGVTPLPSPSTVADFIAERLVELAGGDVSAKDVYADYRQWCADHGVDAKTQTALGKAIKDAGIGKVKVKGLVHYQGVKLVQPNP